MSSSWVPALEIAGFGNVPTTTKRQAGAKVAVRDGETIILGGFISDSRTISDSGIPYLKDIPVLEICSRANPQNLRTELIMLMRPTAPDSRCRRSRGNPGAQLSGVKQAGKIRQKRISATRQSKLNWPAQRQSARKQKPSTKSRSTIITPTPRRMLITVEN